MRFFLFLLIVLFTSNGCVYHNKKEKIILESEKPYYKTDTGVNGQIYYSPDYLRTPIDSQNIQLSFFDTIPPTIGKSGEFYTYDTTRLCPNKYIFLSNDTYAIIRLKGRDIYLHKKYEKSIMVAINTFRDVYSGNGYLIDFIHKELSSDNGISYERGFLEIKNIKYDTVIKIHGNSKLIISN